MGDYLASQTTTGESIPSLAVSWNGKRWTVDNPTDPSAAQESVLVGVSCLPAGACTAVGSYAPRYDQIQLTRPLADTTNF